MSETQKGPLQQATKALRIRTAKGVDRMRRAGFLFDKEPRFLPVTDLEEGQIKSLLAEKRLDVTELDALPKPRVREPTRDELAGENARLRERVAELEAQSQRPRPAKGGKGRK